MTKPKCLIPTILFCFAVVPIYAADTYMFSPIAFPGAPYTVPWAINAWGEVVGYYQPILNGPDHGFLYSKGKYENIDVPGATITHALGISNSGAIIGEFYCGSVTCRHAFLLDRGNYALIEPPGATLSFAISISDRGEILGYATTSNSAAFFIYDHGAFTTLPDVTNGGYTALNSAGSLVGVTGTDSFMVRQETVQGVSVPSAVWTSANAITNSGVVAGTYAPTVTTRHGFTYQGGEFFDVVRPDVGQTHLFGINERGDVVGLSYDTQGSPLGGGFVATKH